LRDVVFFVFREPENKENMLTRPMGQQGSKPRRLSLSLTGNALLIDAATKIGIKVAGNHAFCSLQEISV